jgi:hypothetical protein
MRYALDCLTAPSAEPVTRAEAKTHLRVESGYTQDDALIDTLITAAREWAENETRRAFVYSRWRMTVDNFPLRYSGTLDTPRPQFESYPLGYSGVIKLPRPPLYSVESLAYVDTSGATRSLYSTEQVSPYSDADYQIDAKRAPAVLQPLYGKYWPTARTQVGGVTITYWSGYTPGSGSPTDYAANVPGAIKTAIKFHVEAHYDRDAAMYGVLLNAAKNLLLPYVVRDVGLSN